MKPLALISPMALAACAPPVPMAEDFIPEYLGVETTRLDSDIVQVDVQMTNALTEADLRDYADCAAAQYGLDEGLGFARHLRTNVSQEGGVWSADAVYTLSSAMPDGLAVIDARATVEACQTSGIPTV